MRAALPRVSRRHDEMFDRVSDRTLKERSKKSDPATAWVDSLMNVSKITNVRRDSKRIR